MRAAGVRTDFVLSAEIIVITLRHLVAVRLLATQIGVMIAIAALMTVGVYGLVAGIVRLDDMGLYLSHFPDGARRRLGRAILAMAPYLMRTLSVVGTAAMFLVGGGILAHGFPGAREAIDHLVERAADVPLLGGVLGPMAVLVANGLAGVLGGAAVFGVRRGARASAGCTLGSDTRVTRPGIDRGRRNSPTRRAGPRSGRSARDGALPAWCCRWCDGCRAGRPWPASLCR